MNNSEMAEFLEKKAKRIHELGVMKFQHGCPQTAQQDFDESEKLRQSAAALRSAESARDGALRDAIRTVEDAGGDNALYHADAIRAILTNNPKADPVKPEGETGYKELFSGDYSRDMWEKIRKIVPEETSDTLYLVCCRIQEMETQLKNLTGG